jgi:hypothetical protein
MYMRRYGPTIATLIILGIVIFAVIDTLMNVIGYAVTSAVNATSMAVQIAVSQAGVSITQTATYTVGNYTAVIVKPDASSIGLSSLNRFLDTATAFLGFVLRAFGDKAIFVSLIALGIAILIYEELIEGE